MFFYNYCEKIEKKLNYEKYILEKKNSPKIRKIFWLIKNKEKKYSIKLIFYLVLKKKENKILRIIPYLCYIKKFKYLDYLNKKLNKNYFIKTLEIYNIIFNFFQKNNFF